MGMAGHFALGNSNTLATIDVAGAFIVCRPFLVFHLNTYPFILICHILMKDIFEIYVCMFKMSKLLSDFPNIVLLIARAYQVTQHCFLAF